MIAEGSDRIRATPVLRLALLIRKRPIVAVPVTKSVSQCLQLRIRMAPPPCLLEQSAGSAAVSRMLFRRNSRFSVLSGLEFRLHASGFLRAPTYSRPVVAGAVFVTGTATAGRFRLTGCFCGRRRGADH